MATQKEEKNQVIDKNALDPNKILIAEFEYARETAAQAMDDRHKIVNFFLLIAGVLFNALLLILKDFLLQSIKSYSPQLRLVVAVFCLTIFIMGLLYLLKLIKLRSSWYNSALCMNQIKDYYDEKLPEFGLKANAFRWKKETIDPKMLGKLRTIFGYSAILIVMIDSLAFGGFIAFTTAKPYIAIAPAIVIGIIQILFYKALLAPNRL